METNDVAAYYTKHFLLGIIIVSCLGLTYFYRTETNYIRSVIADTEVRLAQQAKDREKTLDLAMEFGFDPLIVQTVRQLSLNAFRHNKSKRIMWRFVKTDDDLSYILLSIISAESGGNVRAVGDSGMAMGLTQIWTTTAQMYDRKITASRLLTIQGNLTVGMLHFLDLLERYDGNYTLAVLAWNRGSGAVSRSLALGVTPENGYSFRVFSQAALRNGGLN